MYPTPVRGCVKMDIFNLTAEITEKYGVHRGLIMSYLNSMFSVHSSVHSVVKLDFNTAPTGEGY
jgi:hypothetical protein